MLPIRRCNVGTIGEHVTALASTWRSPPLDEHTWRQGGACARNREERDKDLNVGRNDTVYLHVLKRLTPRLHKLQNRIAIAV